MDRSLAYKYLGISGDATMEDIKKAYLNSCKMFHPDNVGSDLYLDKYNQCQEAFLFLSEQYQKSSNDIYDKPKKNRIIGNTSGYSYDHKIYQKKQQSFRESSRLKKEKEYKNIKNISKILASEQGNNKNIEAKNNYSNKVREDEILNQIRWLRIADIIHKTIEADKNKMEE